MISRQSFHLSCLERSKKQICIGFMFIFALIWMMIGMRYIPTMRIGQSQPLKIHTEENGPVYKNQSKIVRFQNHQYSMQWPALLRNGQPYAAHLLFSTNSSGDFVYDDVIRQMPKPIEQDEWVAVVRVQKTASKSVTSTLKWMLADLRGPEGVNTARGYCNVGLFGTSFVPIVEEVEAASNELSTNELTMNPYDFRLKFARDLLKTQPSANYFDVVKNTKKPMLMNRWMDQTAKRYPYHGLDMAAVKEAPDTLFPTFDPEYIGPWYKGAELPNLKLTKTSRHSNKPKGCSGFDLPTLITPNSAKCRYLWQQHMHVGDILGSIWEMMAVPPEKVEMVVGLRHPVRRVLSEYKHLSNLGNPLWDYCHHSDFSDLKRGFSSGNAKFGENDSGKRYFLEFMQHPYHAYGMRNRQTKMLSGLVVEPTIPTHKESMAMFDEYTKFVQSKWSNLFHNKVNDYHQWADAAFSQAIYNAVNAKAVILLERLPESLALLFYSVDWHPSLSVTQRGVFLASSITESSYLASDGPTRDSERPKHSIRVQPEHFEKANNLIVASTHLRQAKQCGALQRILALAYAVGDATKVVEKVDKRKIPFTVDDGVTKTVSAINHLDIQLFDWVDRLVTARMIQLQKALCSK